MQYARQLTISDFINYCEILGLENNINEIITNICDYLIDTYLYVSTDHFLIDRVGFNSNIAGIIDKISDSGIMSMVKLLYGRSLHVPGNYRYWQNEIRNFKEFPFTKDTIKYKDKIEYIKKLTIKDLMIFSSFLCYKHDYLNKVIIQMCNSLIDINTLVIINENMISFVRFFNGIDILYKNG